MAMRRGSAPSHLILVGPSSSGKSYTLSTVQRLLPESAYVSVDAGSPRALIFKAEDFRHRAIFLGEADSLPTNEDGPAASALRALLQENRVRYSHTIKDKDTGGYVTYDLDIQGPCVLITTATRTIGSQMMTRMFTLEMQDDPAKVRAALRAQADVELGVEEASFPELVAYQEYLQMMAPWKVVVPYIARLNEEISHTSLAPRLLRDSSRVVSLIKAVTIMRHAHRNCDSNGRWIAQVEDYEYVRELISPIFADSVADGATRGVHEVVRAVREVSACAAPGVSISETLIAEHLDISKMSVSRRVTAAIAGGWLVTGESRPGLAFNLAPGEPLPDVVALPKLKDA